MSANGFSSLGEAIKVLKLDRRRKWEVWEGEVSYPEWVTMKCSGCDGFGCFECGYHGKRRRVFPCPAFMPNGDTVKIKPPITPNP